MIKHYPLFSLYYLLHIDILINNQRELMIKNIMIDLVLIKKMI